MSEATASQTDLDRLWAWFAKTPPGRWTSGKLQRFDGWLAQNAAREAITLWALCFVAIVIAFQIPGPLAKLIATLGFLYLPEVSMRRRGEGFAHYGVSLRNWKADLKWFAILFGIVAPIFIVAYGGFAQLLPHLPQELQHVLAPYTGTPKFAWRLPDRFAEWTIDEYFVVALPEEFFYRGFMQTRLRDAWPKGRTFLGVRLGPAFWLTAVLFALGHLAIFQVWRLGVFFPALLFAWMREKTGSVMGAALFHGSSNLLVLVLEACFYGR
jgi:membrane protease YdiL (CAAX protease family)